MTPAGERPALADRDLPAVLQQRQPFAKPWHATVFALVVAMHRAGRFTWPEWVQAFARQDRAAPDRDGECAEDGYYRRMVDALQDILAAQGVAGTATLATLDAAWRQAYRATPHGQPVELPAAALAAALAAVGTGAVDDHDDDHDHHHDHAGHHHHDHPRRPARPVAVFPATA